MASTSEPQIGLILEGGTTLGLGPAELLGRFTASRDEAAFAAIVAQHGPMVLATCRRLLAHPADADDAFQATFLVFARQARSIRHPDRLAPWLHRVARRVSLRARTLAARRRAVEGAPEGEVAVAPPRDDLFELRQVLDEELARLPAKYRDPLVLCYLEGLTHDEAAGQLSWPVGTVRSRLAGGRDRLRGRLARRGLAPSAFAVVSPAMLPSAVVSRLLQAATVRLVFAYGSKPAATSVAAMLAHGVLTTMFVTKVQTVAVATLALAATLAAGTTGVVIARQQAAVASQPDPSSQPTPERDGLNPIMWEQEQRVKLKEEVNMIRREMEQTTFDSVLNLERLGKRLAPKEEQIRVLERTIREKGALPPVDPAAASTRPAPVPGEAATELATAHARIKGLEAEVTARNATIRDLESRPARVDQSRPTAAGGPRPDPTPTPTEPPAPISQWVAKLNQGVVALQQTGDALKPDVPPIRPSAISEMKPLQAGQEPPAVAAARQSEIKQIGRTGLLMATSAGRDRVTMIEPKTGRRATLHLGKPVDAIEPRVQLGIRTGLVGLMLQGSAVVKLAIFDPAAMRWHEHTLADPVTHANPVFNDSGTWMTFALNGPKVAEAPAFNLRSLEWRPDTLTGPPQGQVASIVTTDGTKVTKAGPFYYFSNMDRSKVVMLEVKQPANDQGPRGVPFAGLTAQGTNVVQGITTLNDGTLCVQDGDLLHIYHPKEVELTRIDLAAEE